MGVDRWRAAVLVVALAIVAGCSGDDTGERADSRDPSDGTREVPEHPVAPATFAEEECAPPVVVAPPTTARCGRLTVAERHADPGGPTIELPVAILEPPAGLARPDPVIYLDGGPGSDGISMSPVLAELPLAGNHTVVVIGQRGTSHADPSFDCPEAELVARAQYTQELGTDESVSAYQAAVGACHQRVSATSPNLDRYDSAAAADDLEAARRALGYDRWNLYGISYGTRLALEVLRRHPDGVRSVALDSVVPPEVDRFASMVPNAGRAFEELASACADDEHCDAEHPDLLDRVATAFERFEERPVDATVYHPVRGEPVTVRWDGDRMARAAFSALYNASLIPLLPYLLASFERDDLDLATATYLAVTEADGATFAEGLFLTVECRERAPFTDVAAVQTQRVEQPAWLLASIAGEEALEECDHWTVPAAERSVIEPVEADVPTFVLAGRFDPVSPPRWGEQVAAAAGDSFLHVFPAHGHAVSLEPCARQMVAWFFDDPTVDPDRGCLVDLPRQPDWVLSG